MKAGYFVTGTDTGVGKTVVATALALGMDANYWKPVQSGTMEGSDSDFARRWLGSERVHKESYSYPEAIAPHLAARIHGDEISLVKCLQDSLKMKEPAIIEGAGGVLVPLSKNESMVDLMLGLERPVIVVASLKLGTINHTLLTLEALARRHIPVAGHITTGAPNPAVQETLRTRCDSRWIGHIPWTDKFTQKWFSEAFSGLDFANAERSLCTTI